MILLNLILGELIDQHVYLDIVSWIIEISCLNELFLSGEYQSSKDYLGFHNKEDQNLKFIRVSFVSPEDGWVILLGLSNQVEYEYLSDDTILFFDSNYLYGDEHESLELLLGFSEILFFFKSLWRLDNYDLMLLYSETLLNGFSILSCLNIFKRKSVFREFLWC